MAESTYIDRCEFDRTMQERYCFNCERIKETHYPIFGVACKTCWVMDMLDEIENFPAADVRPVVRGKWIEEYECTHPQAKCSACGEPTLYAVSYDIKGNAYYMNFCPNCGADMREVKKVYVAEPLHEQPKEKKNVIHLWMDGYDCTGDHADPSMCGVYEAETLRDAVSMWANEEPDRWKYINMDINPPTFWGCDFFDKKR